MRRKLLENKELIERVITVEELKKAATVSQNQFWGTPFTCMLSFAAGLIVVSFSDCRVCRKAGG